jgi:methionine-rich copper-binding protein CopC
LSGFWSASALPVAASTEDPNAVELGVKFQSDEAGYVTGLRFFKGAGNTGDHVGHLWGADGTMLASVTFKSESDSGWQDAAFDTPVAIAPNTTYIASYFAPNGHYAEDDGFFAGEVSNGPLHILADGDGGPNGVYAYGADAFPTQGYLSTNYWVDVDFTTAAPVNGATPTVVSASPGPNATGVDPSAAPSVTFSEPVRPDSLVFSLTDAAGNAVTTTVSYDDTTNTATFTPSSPLDTGTAYTATLQSAADPNGNALPGPVTWSFVTDGAPPSGLSNLWGPLDLPASAGFNDPSAVELGVKFQSDQAGYITGLRFFKGPGNAGEHVGHLWSASGDLLATATFSGETGYGWQQVNFDTPVAIAPNTTYIASYYAPNGHYAASGNYFTGGPVGNGPLHTVNDGATGVYVYGHDAFPSQSYNATNYWVDVDFAPAGSAPVVTATTPVADTTGLAVDTTVSATFSAAVQPGSISFTLTGPDGAIVPASVSYDSNNMTVTLTPLAPLAESATYTATLSASDLSGTPMVAPATWSFTTDGAWQQTTVADFSAGTMQGTTVTNVSGGEVQLGAGFSDDFSSTKLSSAWTSSPWVAGGKVSLNGAVLAVAGTEVLSAQTFSDVTIEGRLNFGMAPYHNFGLATDLSSATGNYWAVFSTEGTSNTLFAEVNNNGVMTDVNLGALPVGYHIYRVQPMPLVYQFYVDGQLDATISATFPVTTGLSIVLSTPSATGTALQADWVRQVGGNFTSAVLNAGATASWGTVNWTAIYPPGTIMVVETRSGNTATPDASWSNWTMAYNAGPVFSPDAQYLQYRVTFYTTDPTLPGSPSDTLPTAVLNDITFSWT